MISQKGLSEIIDLLIDMDRTDQEIQNVFGSSANIISRYTEKILDWVLTEVGIPEDNTVEMIKTYGKPEGYFQDDTFCRDRISDWFYEYQEGTITKEKLIFNLLNWKVILEKQE